MYDDFSADYDRFVDWDGRLAAEMPFIERCLEAAGTQRVLDAACGTGRHALALAERGYEVVGTDGSAGMIEQARANASAAGRGDMRFVVAGFGELARTLSLDAGKTPDTEQIKPRFDAVLCLGNSLPHVLTPADLAVTLEDFSTCLHTGGLLLIQNRNFDAVLANRDRWMGPQSHLEGENEWLFLRFYDFDPNGLLTFNVVRLKRERASDWAQDISSTRLWPITEHELGPAVLEAGFDDIRLYGGMRGAPFRPNSSSNLVLAARARKPSEARS
jgi:SAM-dependent methyltransferase